MRHVVTLFLALAIGIATATPGALAQTPSQGNRDNLLIETFLLGVPSPSEMVAGPMTVEHVPSFSGGDRN